MAVVHLDVCLAFDTTLCLHQDGSIDTLIAKKSGGGGVLEDGYTLYFLYTEAVDRTFIPIDEDEDAFIVKRVIATDIKRGSLVLIARETALYSLKSSIRHSEFDKLR